MSGYVNGLDVQVGFDSDHYLWLHFPKANTPICSSELRDIAQFRSDLSELGVDVIVSSPDSAKVISKWADKEGFLGSHFVSLVTNPSRLTCLLDWKGNVLMYQVRDPRYGRGIEELVSDVTDIVLGVETCSMEDVDYE